MAESIEPRRVLLGTQTAPGQRAGLRAWFARRRQHRTDQRNYAYNQEQCAKARTHLARVVDPGDRAQVLMRLFTATHRLATLHDRAHGVEWLDAEERSVATSLMWEAALYRALSDVEAAVVYGTPRPRAVKGIEHAAGPVLDRMAATLDLVARTQLLDDLHAAVLPVVGERAVTAILTLPLPRSLFPQAG